ncbi:MAG TPA: sugar phosphate isomerase/epimerase [Vicinamibacterales bacterium]|nr:sugar phosphate isomerase/epimerase [Vicinamibacterales bacterium]
MRSRREFNKAALAGLTASVLPGWVSRTAAMQVRGVKVGLITGSLNPLGELGGRDPIDVIIEQCKQLDVLDVELVTVFPQGQPEVVNGGRFGQPPAQITPDYMKTRQALRDWRIALPLDRFKEVRRKFDAAKLNLFSYVYTLDDHMTDAEIEAAFRQLQALGVPMFTTNQTRVGMGPRIAPLSEKYNIKAAWHPHAEIQDPNEVATPASMEKLLAMSKSFVINLDIGHFAAGNNDVLAFLKKHHERIAHLHVKDRKRDKGPNVQLGTGDTPIKESATLIRDERWPIMLILEREYRDAPGSPVEQTRWQLNYLKGLLER